MTPLLQPSEITLEDDGHTKTFRISKLPALDGREILTQYIPTAIPKVGNYKENEALMLKLLAFVEVKPPTGDWLRLNERSIINSHVPTWRMLMTLEKRMVVYNCSFFQDGSLSTFLSGLKEKLPQWISKTLTDSLGQLSPQKSPPSTN